MCNLVIVRTFGLQRLNLNYVNIDCVKTQSVELWLGYDFNRVPVGGDE